MKVHWLNAEMTEAIVERGRLWWKRCANVRKSGQIWKYGSGHDVGADLHYWLEGKRSEGIFERANQEREANWQPVRSLPPAKVVGK